MYNPRQNFKSIPLRGSISTRGSISLSQNFLANPKVAREIVDLAKFDEQDLVIEIGPGTGRITNELIQSAGKVIGIEKNTSLYQKLILKYEDKKDKIELVNEDFLDYKLPKIDYKFFANIPFGITTEILDKISFNSNPPIETYLIMQKEAAMRFTGNPKTTQISCLLYPIFAASSIYFFDPADFNPIANVDIVLFKMQKREVNLLKKNTNFGDYKDFIYYVFNSNAISVFNTFKTIFSNIQLGILSTRYGFSKQTLKTEIITDVYLELFIFFIDNTPFHKRDLVRRAAEKYAANASKIVKEHRTNTHSRKSNFRM